KPDDPDASSLKDEINEIDSLLSGNSTSPAEMPPPQRPFHPGYSHLKPDEIPEYLDTLRRLQAKTQKRLNTQKPGSILYTNTKKDHDRFDAEITSYQRLVDDPSLYQKAVIAETDVRKAEASADFTRGIGCLAIGLVASAIGYFAAGPGDRFYVFWGAIAVGVIYIFTGIIQRNM
ncbi:MAG: hypothetical protein WBA46_09140, partial [Thermomicrobiales bacterium]